MKTRITYKRHFPFKGYVATTIFPFIIVRKDMRERFTQKAQRHEMIHVEQQKEMLLLPFFIFYVVEWAVRLIQYRNAKEAYMNISFEREAYAYEDDTLYLARRKAFAWINFLTR